MSGVLPLAQPLGWGGLPRALEPIATRVVGPVAEPVLLARAKTHLRVDSDFVEDDDYIQGLIAVGREEVERHARRALYRQQWQLSLDRFEPVIRLPVPPLMAVEAVKYVDQAGNQQTLDPTLYQVELATGSLTAAFGVVWPTTRPQPGAVQVLFWCGYTDGVVNDANPAPGDPLGLVPPSAKHAILLLVGHWYENREEVVVGPATSALPRGVAALLGPLRAWRP